MNNTLELTLPDRGVTVNMPTPQAKIALWPPPTKVRTEFTEDNIPQEDRDAVQAMDDEEFARDCRRWLRAILDHMRARGIKHHYRKSQMAIYIDVMPGDPIWEGVDPIIVGQLASVPPMYLKNDVVPMGGTECAPVPSPHQVNWPRLAKSLRLG